MQDTAAAGAVSRSRDTRSSAKIDWPETLRAKGPESLQREHLRFAPFTPQANTLHCLLVDCSGSMLSSQQLALAKGLLMQLIQRAHEQRADIAIVGFSGASAQLILPVTRARPMASAQVDRWLQPVRGGGATPFAQGVTAAANVLAKSMNNERDQQRWLWLLTDGRTTELPARPAAADVVVVVDCERSRVPLHGCRTLAQRWGAHYQHLSNYAQEISRGRA